MAEAQPDLANRRPSELTRDEWQSLRDRYVTALGAANALGVAGSTVVRYWNRHGIAYEHSNVRAADRVRLPTNSTEPEYAPLLAVLKRKNASHSVIDIANALNRAPKEVERLAAAARADRYVVDISNEGVNLQRVPDHTPRAFVHDFYGAHWKVAFVSCTHHGSIYAADEERRQFYAFCRKEGVEHIYHCGDVTAGNNVYRGQLRDLREDCIKADSQAQRATEDFVAADLPISFILGNHDDKWLKDLGFNIGEHIEARAKVLGAKRPIRCLGSGAARIIIGKKPNQCVVDLQHPGGGTAYALSYRSQKIVESYTGGDKPHVIAIGHFHKAEVIPHLRNTTAIQPGCFEWQTPFMRSRAIEAHVAGCIAEGWMAPMERRDSRSTLTRLRTEFVKFYAPEREAAG